MSKEPEQVDGATAAITLGGIVMLLLGFGVALGLALARAVQC